MYLDFSLRLPGFTLHVIKYVDEKTHELRYVLKNKRTGDVYLVVLFTLEHDPYAGRNSESSSHRSSRRSSNQSKESQPQLPYEAPPCADDVD
jgi:hypothetical protein